MHLGQSLRNLKVAVIGGSIAGCSAAILLRQRGAKVAVFERSLRPHTGRGAGIVLPEAMIKSCVDNGLFDETIPRLRVDLGRTFLVKDDQAVVEGRVIWKQPSFVVFTLNWGDIYQNLRKRIPDDCYHAGEKICSVLDLANACQVETSSGKKFEFDLLIAADGIDSVVRKQIFPDIAPEYAGYVAWRGVTSQAAFVDNPLFDKHVPYFAYPGGHILLYRIPAGGNQATGNSLLNWVMYEDCRDKSLKELLTDKSGTQQAVSLPPGSMSARHIDHLHRLAKNSLPASIADIIEKTEDPFMQAVFDLQVPQFAKNRICFMGDAASILRPHTASGVIKALNDSLGLVEVLDNEELGTLSKQLQAWNDARVETARKEVALSKNMGEGLVTKSPDWSAMNQAKMDEWWKDVMSGNSWYATRG